MFLFAPVVLLVAFSFNANRYGTFLFTGFTTKWYGQVFGDYQIKDALTTTLKIALQVTLVSTVVGTAGRLPLVRSRLKFRGDPHRDDAPDHDPGSADRDQPADSVTSVFKWQLARDGRDEQAVYTTPFVLLPSRRGSRVSTRRSSGRRATSERTRTGGFGTSSCR